MATKADYEEALRLIRQHMRPGDTVGKMFLRVAKALETEAGEVCDGCGRLLVCRHCGKFRSAPCTKYDTGAVCFTPLTDARPERETEGK